MTMPTGDDPSGYQTDGQDGVTGALGGGLSALAGRTRDAVTAAKKNELSGNDIVSTIGEALFNGLRTGVAFPLALIEAIVKRLFGLDVQFAGMDDAIAAIKKVPVLGDLVEILSGIEDGDLNDLGTWFNNNIVGGLQNIVNTIVHALTGLPTTGAVLDEVYDGLHDLFNTANDAFAHAVDALGDLGDLIHNLLTNPGAVIGAIPQALVDGLQGALSTANDFIQGVVKAIIGAIRGIPFVGGSIADTLSALTGTMKTYTQDVSTNQVNAQNFTISTLTAGSRNPSWVSRYAIGDVTFPEAMNLGVFSNNLTPVGGPGELSLAAGSGFGGNITCANTTVYDTVGVSAYYTGTKPTGVYVDIWRKLDDGSRVLVYTSEEISSLMPTTGNIGFTAVPIRGGGIVANAGDVFLVRLINAAGSQTIKSLVMLNQPPSLDIGSSWSGQVPGAKASLTAAEFSTASLATFYMSYMVLATANPVVTDQSYSDDFNRINLGALWLPLSVTTTNLLGITSSQCAYQGTVNGVQNALYIKRTVGVSQRVDGDFYNVSSSDQGIFLAANRELGQMVYLGVTATGATIYSGTLSSLTPRATKATTVNDTKDGVAGLTWSLYCTPSTNTYTVLKDGVDIGLSWVDTGNVTTHTEAERFGGLRFTRTSGVSSGQIDNWTLRDWAA